MEAEEKTLTTFQRSMRTVKKSFKRVANSVMTKEKTLKITITDEDEEFPICSLDEVQPQFKNLRRKPSVIRYGKAGGGMNQLRLQEDSEFASGHVKTLKRREANMFQPIMVRHK